MRYEPQRTCIVCREQKDKAALTRIVKSGEDISVDPSGKAPGRGAYVCDSAECRERLIKKRVLNRAFKLDISAETYERIRRELEARDE